MVKFLLFRPIAVSMTFLSLFILGWIASQNLPVSLMPDIDVPEITVQLSYPNLSARQMENTIVAPIRRQLLQVSRVDDIISDSRTGNAVIRLRMEYGANMHYAFVAVNEKIDMAMQSLPQDMNRPRVIKASAVDIPVLNINITNSNHNNNSSLMGHEKENLKFMELSSFSENVIKRRFEQLPEIALVDISGLARPEIAITPDTIKMENLGLTAADIDKALDDNNKTLGSIRVQQGLYQYHIRVASALTNISDVRNLYLNKNGRLFKMGDIADIKTIPVKERGVFISNGSRAVTLALIKQSEARMETLKAKVYELTNQMISDYPELNFEVVRDQGKLLDMALSSLDKSLFLGGIMAFLILFFFLKDARAPLLIAISIPASVIISLLFFNMVGLTINIVSLSGLILGVGMMIDNSIIVIDNISQYLDRGEKLSTACITGTNEVITPLLSSVLTTCAVFLPLIFLSGITGAIFYDQAMAVSIGLFTSLGVSITLLPVYFHLFYRNNFLKTLSQWLKKASTLHYEGVYLKGFKVVFSNRKWSVAVFIFLALTSFLWYSLLEKERFPVIPQKDMVLKIDWNENININENLKRSKELLSGKTDFISHYDAHVGEQQFLLNRSHIQSQEEVAIYINAGSEERLLFLKNYLSNALTGLYPSATFLFEQADNIFEQVFSDKTAPFEIRLIQTSNQSKNTLKDLMEIRARLMDTLRSDVAAINTHREINIQINYEKLILYNVETEQLIEKLRSALNENLLSEVMANRNFIPIRLGLEEKRIDKIVSSGFVLNTENKEIPIRELLTMYHGEGLKNIQGGKEGEYYPFQLHIPEGKLSEAEEKARVILSDFPDYRTLFKGSLYTNKVLVKDMFIVMAVSLLLLYFILAAQFESLWQPLIVLTEVPINLAAAFFMLYIFGNSINIMSLIGLVVMSGIIINDSILKIDTINRLMKKGYPVEDAIKIAGERRLKPILMTSLTTILALMPFLFSNDLGSILQKPLALVIIGGMMLGTFVSLYYVPLFYLFVKSSRKKNK